MSAVLQVAAVIILAGALSLALSIALGRLMEGRREANLDRAVGEERAHPGDDVGLAIFDEPCSGGGGFSRLLAHLDAGLAAHADRDGLTGVQRAVFMSRGGHAPGTRCPTEVPDDRHDYWCDWPDDDCACTVPPTLAATMHEESMAVPAGELAEVVAVRGGRPALFEARTDYGVPAYCPTCGGGVSGFTRSSGRAEEHGPVEPTTTRLEPCRHVLADPTPTLHEEAVGIVHVHDPQVCLTARRDGRNGDICDRCRPLLVSGGGK